MKLQIKLEQLCKARISPEIHFKNYFVKNPGEKSETTLLCANILFRVGSLFLHLRWHMQCSPTLGKWAIRKRHWSQCARCASAQRPH